MEVILIQDMLNLGQKDDIIKVKDGYGRNYLIAKGYAVLATESAKKVHAENLKQRSHKEEKVKNEALELSAKLKDVKLTIGAKTSTTGKIFGSVNTIQIAEVLLQKGYQVDRKRITIKEDTVKHIGNYTAIVRLHREIAVEIPFEVISE
jgi:large subunit ribosomal protein L9